MNYAKQTFPICHCGLDPQSPNPIGEAPNSIVEVNNSIVEVNNSIVEVNNSFVEVNNSIVEVNNSFVEVNNSFVEVNNSIVEVNNSIAEVNNPIGEAHNSDCLPVIAGLTRNPLNSALHLCRGSRVKRGMTRGQGGLRVKPAMTERERSRFAQFIIHNS
ncbi:MAG: hypothetical protein LBP72_03215 [Dysgonamonadaceae bacterium]|jgi:hypothetical protein|nr:hypothetical protein [Dysgonamonadaceae bacterium]